MAILIGQNNRGKVQDEQRNSTLSCNIIAAIVALSVKNRKTFLPLPVTSKLLILSSCSDKQEDIQRPERGGEDGSATKNDQQEPTRPNLCGPERVQEVVLRLRWLYLY